MAEPQEVEIVGIGARGDGIAEAPHEQSYIAYALPGERWRLTDGAPSVMLRPHPERAEPICRHFGSCGGCVAQHMPDALYAAWKRGVVVDAFRHRGIDANVGTLFRVPPASRRRLTVYARRYADNLRLGFYRAATHELVDVVECPIAMPPLVAALPVLREMLEPILPGQAEASIHMLATPAGLDVHVAFARFEPARTHHPRLAALASRHGFARLTVGRETLMLGRQPTLDFGGVDVSLPPQAFVQAVDPSEGEMVRLVLAATTKAKRVADLFCGLGTFTFPLARRASVLAIDHSEEAVAALAAAVQRGQGLKPIEARVRDLYRMPLAAKELDAFDAVVLDPARAGAHAQCEQLARSKVECVVAVSCNPATLARDVRTLIDGGYELEAVTPIDQFLFASHVEAVAVLRRPNRSRRA